MERLRRTSLRVALPLLAVAPLLTTSARAADDRAQSGLELQARAGGAVGERGLGAPVGLGVGWRTGWLLSLGVYGEAPVIYSPIVPKCECDVDRSRPFRAGVYADFRILHIPSAQPWLRLATGVMRTERTAADVEAGLGVAFRAGPIAIGPYLWSVQSAGRNATGWYGAGLALKLPL